MEDKPLKLKGWFAKPSVLLCGMWCKSTVFLIRRGARVRLIGAVLKTVGV